MRAMSYLKPPSPQMLGFPAARSPEHLLIKPTSLQSLSLRRNDGAEAHKQLSETGEGSLEFAEGNLLRRKVMLLRVKERLMAI